MGTGDGLYRARCKSRGLRKVAIRQAGRTLQCRYGVRQCCVYWSSTIRAHSRSAEGRNHQDCWTRTDAREGEEYQTNLPNNWRSKFRRGMLNWRERRHRRRGGGRGYQPAESPRANVDVAVGGPPSSVTWKRAWRRWLDHRKKEVTAFPFCYFLSAKEWARVHIKHSARAHVNLKIYYLMTETVLLSELPATDDSEFGPKT